MGTPIGTPDWGTHTALIREVTVSLNTAIHVGPGVTQTLIVPLTKIGYSVLINMFDFSGASAIPMEFKVTWLDSAGPNILGRQRWSAYAGTAANPHNIVGHGPCESGTMRIDMINHHGVDTASVSIDVADVSQPYAGHDWFTDDTLAPVFPGFTSVASDVIAGVVGIVNQFNVAANSTAELILPLRSGRVTFHVDNAPTKSSAYDIVNRADQALASGVIFCRQVILPGGVYSQNVTMRLPRGQCSFIVSNFDTALMTANMALVAG